MIFHCNNVKNIFSCLVCTENFYPLPHRKPSETEQRPLDSMAKNSKQQTPAKGISLRKKEPQRKCGRCLCGWFGERGRRSGLHFSKAYDILCSSGPLYS